jgi:hypothetical protein
MCTCVCVYDASFLVRSSISSMYWGRTFTSLGFESIVDSLLEDGCVGSLPHAMLCAIPLSSRVEDDGTVEREGTVRTSFDRLGL